VSEPQNPLEEALAEAATGRAEPERFYEELLRSDLYAVVDVHGDVTRIAGGRATLAPDAGVHLLPLDLDGERAYAAFTSPARLEQATGGGVPYASVPASVLFRETPRDARLILNPGVWYGKELLPWELERLAAGLVPGEGALAPTTLDAGAELMLGLPAEPPEPLLDGLRELFAASNAVRSARLGHVFQAGVDPEPHPVVGVEPEPGVSLEDALAGVDEVVERAHVGAVDFVPLDDGEVGSWLREHVEPFFERS
jgi:hypothetical protein